MTPLHLFDESAPPPKQKRHGRRLPNFLRESETEHLCKVALEQIDKATCPSKVRAAQVDQIIVVLGFFMGLRVSEISGLKIEHVDLDAKRCLVFQGKGAKDRYVPIPGRILGLLRAFIGERKEGLVITTRRDKRFRNETIEWRTARLGRLAGFAKKLKPHTARHTYAVRLLEKGASIHEIRDLLGHSSVAVSDVYLACSTDRLQAAVDRL